MPMTYESPTYTYKINNYDERTTLALENIAKLLNAQVQLKALELKEKIAARTQCGYLTTKMVDDVLDTLSEGHNNND